MRIFGIDEQRLTMPDGTGIAYWISRPPAEQDSGFTLALVNGIGVPREIWEHIVDGFRDRFRILFFDYRGSYRSEIPADRRRVGVDACAEDLVTLLEHEGLDRVICVGWSMGVQVILEACRLAHARMKGLVLISGTGGETLDTAFGIPGLIYWVPPVTRFLTTRLKDPFTRLLRERVLQPSLVPLFQRLRLAGKMIDVQLFLTLIENYGQLDFEIYAVQLASLGYHSPVHLNEIQTPTLVMVGDRDMLTPPLASKHIRDSLPNAELVRFEKATHFLPLEYPTEVRQHIHGFLEKRVRVEISVSP